MAFCLAWLELNAIDSAFTIVKEEIASKKNRKKEAVFIFKKFLSHFVVQR